MVYKGKTEPKPWDDDIPPYYNIQLQFIMAVYMHRDYKVGYRELGVIFLRYEVYKLADVGFWLYQERTDCHNGIMQIIKCADKDGFPYRNIEDTVQKEKREKQYYEVQSKYSEHGIDISDFIPEIACRLSKMEDIPVKDVFGVLMCTDTFDRIMHGKMLDKSMHEIMKQLRKEQTDIVKTIRKTENSIFRKIRNRREEEWLYNMAKVQLETLKFGIDINTEASRAVNSHHAYRAAMNIIRLDALFKGHGTIYENGIHRLQFLYRQDGVEVKLPKKVAENIDDYNYWENDSRYGYGPDVKLESLETAYETLNKWLRIVVRNGINKERYIYRRK